jgi:hypothetical protein
MTLPSVTQKEVLYKKKAAEKAKEKRRDVVCRAPTYPGKPSDYAYVLSEHCRLKSAKKEGDEKRMPVGVKKRKPVGVKKEIAMLEKELDKYPEKYRDPNAGEHDLQATVEIFRFMVSEEGRRDFPDPALRFKYYLDRMIAIAKRKKYDVVYRIPRKAILTMVMYHLREMVSA